MPDDAISAYATAVIAGEVPAGRLVHLACQRHLRDLELAEAPAGHPDGAVAGSRDRQSGYQVLRVSLPQ
jgi:hypothetical protein